jgi:putative transposase
MARIAVPGVPYHVTQRGNRRQPVFFGEVDYRTYLHLLQEQRLRWGLQVWAYCLMTNHAHLIVVPDSEQSLARGIGETHQRYTRYINFREGWRGYLWQGRFASVPLDEAHLIAAMRYVERNPIEAGLVQHAEDYRWSSAKTHVTGISDLLLSPHPLQETISDWQTFLASADEVSTTRQLEQQLRTGRPRGHAVFLERLERQLGRPIRRRPPGRQPAKRN